MRDSAGRFILQVDCAYGPNWIKAIGYLLVAKVLLDERQGFELQRDDVAMLPHDRTRNFREALTTLKPRKPERGAFGEPDLRRRRILEMHGFGELIPDGGDFGGHSHETISTVFW